MYNGDTYACSEKQDVYSIRAKFTRGEEVRYISHLDLMRTFERAFRRSTIPVAYSQGFNPHPLMVFGLPLAVGVTSEAEYADFQLTGLLSPADFIKALNVQLPPGIKIVDAGRRNSGDNIMASIYMALYDIMVYTAEKLEITELNRFINEFLLEPVITVEKEGKNGLKKIDIRPFIHEIKAEEVKENIFDAVKENILMISCLLSAGSQANLRPELLISALNSFSGMKIGITRINRTGLYVRKGNEIAGPLDEIALNV